MRIVTLRLLGVVLLLVASSAGADRFVPYTDGRAGGCMLNRANVLYGCTPQPTSGGSGSSSNDRSPPEGFQAQNREDYCWQERKRLENANSDFNRTVTSMRAAEERFERSGCE